MKLILMGAPGAGKGTQAEVISERFEIPAISTGSVLREAIRSGSELGKIAKSLIDEGKFVPDNIINPVVAARIAQPDCAGGFILDGYPRDLAQAEWLEEMGVQLDKVLFIHLSDEAIITRLSGRRICEDCGETYHILYQPSNSGERCEKCGGKLIIRKDDRPETIRERLDTFHRVTYPVVEYYREKGILLEVESAGTVEATTEQTLRVLEDGQ
ncbi:MAG: adenylate kinase [Angelakisella sp.]